MFGKRVRPVSDWPMDVAGPVLLDLVQRIISMAETLSVSPASPASQAFAADLTALVCALDESGGKPGAILSIANDLEKRVAIYGAWQTAEVARTIEAMTQMLKVIAESLRDSVSDLEGTEGDLTALSSALELAEQAQSIDDVRRALDGQWQRVRHIQEVQTRQRKRCQVRLEATISTLEAELASAIRDSFTDGLTGALNRAGFESRFAEIKQRLPEARWSLAMFDLDGFKTLNDTLGHLAGDAALKAFLQSLREIAPEATLARFGGDEFVLISRHDARSMRSTLSKFRAHLPRKEIRVDGPKGVVTMRLATSFGVTDLAPSDTLEAAVARADEELYAMKRQFSVERAA